MSREAKVAAAVGAVMFAVLALLVRPVAVGAVQDDGIYVILGKALASGQGYRYLHLPGAPHGIHFPPLYPALLAVLWRIAPAFPGNVVVFQFANVLLTAFAAGFAVRLAVRAGLPVGWAAAASLAGFLMIPTLAAVTPLLSEPMWLAATIPLLWWAEGVVRRAEVPERECLLLGLAIGISALIRTQSIVLLGAVVAVLLVRRAWKAAALCGSGGALLVIPWMVWMRWWAGELPELLHGKYGSYGSWLASGVRAAGWQLFPRVMIINARDIGGLVAYPFAGQWPSLLAHATTAIVACLFLAGAWRLARTAPVLLLTLGAFGAIVLAWPFGPQRFIWSVWPFIVLLVVVGARGSVEWAVGRPVALGGLAMLLALPATGAALTTASGVRRGLYARTQEVGLQRLAPALEWVTRHAPPRALIASDDETAVYLYTGRMAVPTATFVASARLAQQDHTVPPSGLGEIVGHYRPDFVIAAWQRTAAAADSLTRREPPLLRRIDDLGIGAVFARCSAPGVGMARNC